MISLVIPIFNEEENVNLLYQRLKNTATSWSEDYEVLFIDDGSVDDSYKLMKEISDKDEKFKIIKLSRNFGHQAAISAGIALSEGESVIIMDADLQDPPELVSQFLEEWRNGIDVVYAVRKNRKENLVKRASYNLFYRILQKIADDIDIPIDAGDFCLMDRKVVKVLNDMPEKTRFVRGLRAFSGFKQKGIEYDRPRRAAGTPKYNFNRLIRLAMDGILDFSIVPLRISTYMGAVISVSSFFIGLFFIIHRLFNFNIFGYSPTDTPGLASLAVGIFFLGGIILLTLGIIGEYTGRIYLEVKQRPPYIIEHIYNGNK